METLKATNTISYQEKDHLVLPEEVRYDKVINLARLTLHTVIPQALWHKQSYIIRFGKSDDTIDIMSFKDTIKIGFIATKEGYGAVEKISIDEIVNSYLTLTGKRYNLSESEKQEHKEYVERTISSMRILPEEVPLEKRLILYNPEANFPTRNDFGYYTVEIRRCVNGAISDKI
ncbi:hypothetical protein GOV05_03895 [Candidatus Woesearchaeota archaeon]|nr:hypothetical protein [Candidatus Woesearchaeota archaeon]